MCSVLNSSKDTYEFLYSEVALIIPSCFTNEDIHDFIFVDLKATDI